MEEIDTAVFGASSDDVEVRAEPLEGGDEGGDVGGDLLDDREGLKTRVTRINVVEETRRVGHVHLVRIGVFYLPNADDVVTGRHKL